VRPARFLDAVAADLGELAPETKRLHPEDGFTQNEYGGRYVVKWLRRLDPSVRPELEVARVLARHDDVPVPVPVLEGSGEHYLSRIENMTIAIVSKAARSEGNACTFATEELRRYFDRTLARAREELVPPPRHASPMLLASEEPPPLLREMIGGFRDAASLLGVRTAELHLALSTHSDDAACLRRSRRRRSGCSRTSVSS